MGLAGDFGGTWTIHAWQGLALVTGVMLNAIDGGQPSKRIITQSRKLELQSVLHSLPEAVFLFDTHCRIVELNRAAEHLTGQSRNELLAMDADALSGRLVDVGTGLNGESIVTRALRGDFIRHERHIFRKDPKGTAIDVRISGSPIYYPSNRLRGVLIVIEDVTELSGLQQQVASSERHFAVGQMTAGLAHDFNNILGTISQAVYVLEMAPDRTDSDRNMLNIINSAVRRGAEIVNHIRQYLRGNSETPARVDMRELLEEVLQLAQPMLEMHSGITVQHRIEGACEVYASPPELRRVFTNLVLNALDAMPEGGSLTILCSQREGRVVASVGDTGAGIPLDRQSRIFSPYFTTKAKGMGLGLSGARKAIQAQGGDIRFKSSPGEGTTFYVSLPVAAGQARQDPRAA